MKRNRLQPGLSSLAFTLATICGMSGATAQPTMTNAGNAAIVNASKAAAATISAVKRQAPKGIFGSLHRHSRIFAHSSLNQRQRRKFNRQRFAAGDKRAFA